MKRTIILLVIGLIAFNSCITESTRIKTLNIDSQQVRLIRLGAYANIVDYNDTIIIEISDASYMSIARHSIYSLNNYKLPEPVYIDWYSSMDSMYKWSSKNYYKAVIINSNKE